VLKLKVSSEVPRKKQSSAAWSARIGAPADRRACWIGRELCFVAWTRETGVIPGALASILVATHAPQADVLAAIIFMVIPITIIVQATTAKWVAGQLGLLVGD
jgi:cell volume regulation protein A